MRFYTNINQVEFYFIFVPNICNLTIRSQIVRNRWGVLMRSGEARKKFPNNSVNNVITLSTRVRIQLLKVCISIYFTSIKVVVYILLLVIRL
jgi:hypothetical protein